MKLKEKIALRYIRARLNILALVSPRQAAIKAFRIFCTPQLRAPHRASSLFDKGEALSFRLEGHTVRGRRWLPEAGLTPKAEGRVLIVHGFESAARDFDGYLDPLLKKGYEVLAFDAPAHGESGGKRISLPLYVQVLKTIGQNYGPIHSYMGHSLGALALALYLEDDPREAGGDSPEEGTRLALIAPAAETTTAAEAFSRMLQLSPEVSKAMDEYVQETSGHPFAWYSLRRALHQVRAGILYLQDEEDRITPLKEALEIKGDHHHNIRFVFTRGLGHRKIYKDPAIRQLIVDFL
jgi:pimeloyl-ACP methyl ester carboxylesterase